ncbi:MAG TPA: cupin domain-containing protein [Gaiellaceae bacterium]|nr:cupin domain-containing protein [Gaiellaceae bacterium]
MEVAMQSVNIFGVDKPEGRLDVAGLLGSSALTMFVYDLEPGRSSSPYHYEYEEEWLLVVDGTLVLRAPDGEHTLQRGDLLRFPAGPDGAHKVMNRGDARARTLMFSSARVPAVSVYPDSDKIGIWSGNEPDELIFKRGTAVPWSEGEDGWQLA